MTRVPTRYYRPTVLALLLALCLPASAESLHEQMRALDIDIPRERLAAPLFELPALDSSSVRLADYRGRLVLIHFWATFCASCRDEMPALATLAGRFADSGLVVLAVAVDRGNRSGVAEFARRYGQRLTVPLDADGEVRKRYEIEALPTTYLVGRDGRFLGRSIGARHWDSAPFAALVEQLTAP